MEGSVQNKERLWTKRRHAKQLKLEMANQYTDGVVIPTQDIIKVLETLITPGERGVGEEKNKALRVNSIFLLLAHKVCVLVS
ncbi:malonate decarboxylase subunit alpha [Acinetobacter baumannii]|nr:malonate decarboxylase subunit alpha [Acinetobacter baumannii]